MAKKQGVFKVAFSQKGMLPKVKQALPTLVSAATEIARNEWVKAAKAGLKTSKAAYIAGIGNPVVKGKTGTIKLSGWLPNKIEDGASTYDMKPGFLHSLSAKGKGSNKYFTVPFTLKSAGSQGAEPPVMPNPIYNIAKKLQFGQRMTLPTKYEGYGMRSKLSQDTNKFGNYTWKSSPFEGITKVQKWSGLNPSSSGPGSIGAYKTFRRISAKSDPNSWIHPGLSPRNLMEQASARLEEALSGLLETILGG